MRHAHLKFPDYVFWNSDTPEGRSIISHSTSFLKLKVKITERYLSFFNVTGCVLPQLPFRVDVKDAEAEIRQFTDYLRIAIPVDVDEAYPVAKTILDL